MTSAIERAVDSLSDPDVALSDCLRTVLVVAKRIGAENLATWINAELDGYSQEDVVPAYRLESNFAVAVVFDGFGGTQETRMFSRLELTDELGAVLDDVALRQPLKELETLAAKSTKLGQPLPMQWVMVFRSEAEANRVPTMLRMTPNDARIEIPHSFLVGLLDRIKTVALNLVLDLQSADPDAGQTGGPTIDSDPALAQVVNNYVTNNNIHASNSNVAVTSGSGAMTVQKVKEGDVTGLLEAAKEFINAEGIAALKAALESDGGEPANETRSFLDRVKDGVYSLPAGVAHNAAFVGIVELVKLAFPSFLPN